MAEQTVQEFNRGIPLDALDQLDSHHSYAQTFAHMLEDLVHDVGAMAGPDASEPSSNLSKMHACIESLKDRLVSIQTVVAELRAV